GLMWSSQAYLGAEGRLAASPFAAGLLRALDRSLALPTPASGRRCAARAAAMTTGRPYDAQEATGLARYRRSPVSGQAAHLALAVSLLPRPDPPDLFRPGLLLLSRGRDHPLSARGGPGRMHRGDQGQNLLSPRRHAGSALRRAEPGHRHLHDLLRRPYQSDSLPRAALLPGGGSDRYLQPSDARGGEEHSAGPAHIHGFDGVPPTQSACPQSNLLRGSRPAVLRAPDRGPGHRPHHPLHAETEST